MINWDNEIETWRTGPRDGVDGQYPNGRRAAWDATRHSLVSPPLTYQLPVGFQPAGEPWAWTNASNETYVYAPVLRAMDWSDSGAPGGMEVTPYGSGGEEDYWHAIPALIVLEMENWGNPVEVIDIWPEQPRVGDNYCDAIGLATNSDSRGVGTFCGDGLQVPGQGSWGRVAWAGGHLVEICRVGSWVVPRIEGANQFIALNLDTRQYIRRNGWNGLPAKLASVPGVYDPKAAYDGLDFSVEYFSRSKYEVCGPVGSSSILVYREDQTWMNRVISAFASELTPPHTVTYESSGPHDAHLNGQTSTTQDFFFRKWVNATSGAGLAHNSVPPGREDWNNHYQWTGPTAPDLQCGDVPGAPWITRYWVPTAGGKTFNHVGRLSDAWAVFGGPYANDLNHIVNTPHWDGPRLSEVTGRWEEWILPIEEEDELQTVIVREFDEGDAYEGEVLTAGASIAMRHSGFNSADLDPQPVGEGWPRRFSIGDTEMPYFERDGEKVDLVTSIDYSLGSGTGVALHKAVEGLSPDPDNPGQDRWLFWIVSMDQNNCPGPGGPYLLGPPDGSPPPPLPSNERYHLTRLWQVPYGKQQLYLPPPGHTSRYVTDGDLIIWLPRQRAAKTTTATQLPELKRQARIVAYRRMGALWTTAWAINVLDHVGAVYNEFDRLQPESGGCVSNGVLTKKYLYLVVYDGTGQTLLRIDRETGSVLNDLQLSHALGTQTSVYRDNLVVVNRRLVGVGNTTFEVIPHAE